MKQYYDYLDKLSKSVTLDYTKSPDYLADKFNLSRSDAYGYYIKWFNSRKTDK
jgi:hypothetical protein